MPMIHRLLLPGGFSAKAAFGTDLRFDLHNMQPYQPTSKK